MASLGREIRARRRSLGLTLEALAARAGCTKGYLSTIETGRRERPPSEGILRRLERALRLERGVLVRAGQWQATPEGIRKEMRGLARERDDASRLAGLLRARGIDEAYRSGELQRLVDRLAPGSDVAPAKLPVQVPVINKVPAGYPKEFTDLGFPARVADEYVSAPDLYDPDAFAARVVGDSMAPAYAEGDIVIFSPERDTPSGSDCFVRLERDGETTFKRVYLERDGGGREWIRLQPLNSAYAARVERREDVAGMYAAAYVVRSAATVGGGVGGGGTGNGSWNGAGMGASAASGVTARG